MRLLAAGQRPVSNVVDASNYVMLELGKPVHTFDAAAVHAGADGRRHDRRPPRRRRGAARDPRPRGAGASPRTCCSSPTRDGPIGVAGVMGGATSEVSDATTDVVIESAVFDPVSIRRTAQRLALRSEASSRFEKGQEHAPGADRRRQDGAARRRVGRRRRSRPGASTRRRSSPTRRASRSGPRAINRLLGTDLTGRRAAGRCSRGSGIETEPAAAGERVTVALRPSRLVVDPRHGRRARRLVPTWRRDVADRGGRGRGGRARPRLRARAVGDAEHGDARRSGRRRSRSASWSARRSPAPA